MTRKEKERRDRVAQGGDRRGKEIASVIDQKRRLLVCLRFGYVSEDLRFFTVNSKITGDQSMFRLDVYFAAGVAFHQKCVSGEERSCRRVTKKARRKRFCK